MMQQLKSGETLDTLIAQNKFSLLYFSASWCGPCQSMTPVMATIASLMQDRVNIIKVDIDAATSDLAKYGVRSVPTFMLVKEEQVIAQQVGAIPATELTQWLEQHV